VESTVRLLRLTGARAATSPQERNEITESFDASLQEKVAADPATAKCARRVALLLIATKSDRFGKLQRLTT